ncbi:adenomatous polyposis coli protein-like isoform X2 [Anthonomus grandis grandis]|uniref:adenomatous polyposis coli protein-like isoform X2 n=1 Tax=Anthonomus grandis grandis TaxID=2921223 RepID=UPI002165257F|nr:adenomatous polyposis coli protein-like isoform X2 [Anthonomus grandis grandis]
MSLPVSQYEALLAEVRGLRRKAQRVQQLARPLISGNSSQQYQHDKPLDYTMESLLLNRHDRSNSPNNDHSSTSDQGQLSSEDELRLGGVSRDRSYRSSSQMSVSSEPVSRVPGQAQIGSMFHGAWPNVERTSMWNSEPGSLRLPDTNQHKKDLNSSGGSCQNEISSVMSFASSSGGVPIDRGLCSPDRKWSSQQLEAKMDVVNSLLSMLGSQEHVDMGETLLALSTCPESCLAMRQSGCIPLLVQLVQSDKDNETRKKAAQALYNLVNSQPDEKIKKREIRVLKLLEDARRYIECLKYDLEYESQCADGSISPLQTQEDGDKHPVQTIAHLMKLSFDEGHRQAICQLGGIYTITSLVENEHSKHGSTVQEGNCILMRRYACMALTNLTFGDSGNKALLCSFRDFMRALILQLRSPSDELRQVTASVLRNLSWRADSTSKEILREVGSVTGLMKAAMLQNKENTLKSTLSALWNLSAHCTENKSEICAVEGGLGFLVNMLSYKTPSKSLAIIENAGGILRNISSQIAVRDDYRDILRKHNCLHILLEQLKSPSLTIVANACGTLWNLSAKNAEDQETLWQMGAPAMLRSLNHSKHKMIAMGSSAALKNLLAAKPQQNLVHKMDSTALSLNLPELPSLVARRQKCLMQDLDQSLTETYENLDKDSPVKANADSNVDGGHFIYGRNKTRSRSPEDLTNHFASLNLNEPSISYSMEARNRSKIARNYGCSSLPYVPQPTRRTNPASFLPARTKFSDHAYENPPEQPIDYSQKFFETSNIKGTSSTGILTPSELPQNENDRKGNLSYVEKTEDNFDIGYTETDLDQPTDYSLRYAEDDSDSDICSKITKQEYLQDTVKTYCTEGTPYETPFVFSNANSMSDLRNVGTSDEKPDIDNDIDVQKKCDKKDKKEIKNDEEKDRCSTEDISEMDNTQLKTQKSQFSSGMMSPEKPVNYCEEGTPGYFSRVSSFGSGLDSIPANETVIKKEIKEEVNVNESPSSPPKEEKSMDRVSNAPKTPNEVKVVKFEQVVNYAEQTPLMFSRSSSLASLDSIEQHSIHDDRSSVVSDFSRLTSGIVSPSELPDSPTQTVPSSPRSSKHKIDFPGSSKQRLSENKIRPVPKASVFDDNVTKFKEENTPVQFSTATSLSSLTIDDQEGIENTNSASNTPDTKVKQHLPSASTSAVTPNVEKCEQPPDQQEKKDFEKEKETSGFDDLNDDSDGDEDILAACISDGMQSNISLPTASSTPTKLPLAAYKFQQPKIAATGIPVRTPSRHVPVRTSGLLEDAPKAYYTEDTPAVLSHAGSNSNLSTLSILNDSRSKQGDFSDDSSNLSVDNENILEQCIQSAMPKSKKDIRVNSPQPRASNISVLPRSTNQITFKHVPLPKSEEALKVSQRYNPKKIDKGLDRREKKVVRGDRRESSLPPYLTLRDEVASYEIENSPCQFSLRSSLSDLTVDGSVIGLKPASKPSQRIKTPQDAAGPSRKDLADSLQSHKSRRKESFSSLSSLASNEGDQALLEECIYSGMPTDKQEEALLNECIQAGMQSSRCSSRTMTIDSSIRPETLRPFQRDDFMIHKTNSSEDNRSKNVHVAPVARSIVVIQPQVSQQRPEISTTAAGVENGPAPNWSDIEKNVSFVSVAETMAESHADARIGTSLVADSLPDRFSLSDENLLTDQMKNGSSKSVSQFLEASFESDYTCSNSDNCANLDGVFTKSCEETGHLANNRMLDPDAMIESLDRFTAELVSQASHLKQEKSSQIDKQDKSNTDENTWNDDTSPNELTFPTMSGSLPNVITFDSEHDESSKIDAVDGVVDVNQCEGVSNDFSSMNTTTMTASTLIAIEANKIVTAFQKEADMSQSAKSLDLDSMKLPSQPQSLSNSMTSFDKAAPKSPKMASRKKNMSSNILVKRALSNSANHTSSLENLDNSISNIEQLNPPSELQHLVDLDSSITSIASLPREDIDLKPEFVINASLTAKNNQDSKPHPIFNVKQPFVTSTLNSINADLELMNPPSIFNDITDMCNSLADFSPDSVHTQATTFQDCLTHISDNTYADVTLANDITEFSDANSITPIQSDISSVESTPKRIVKPLTKNMMTKQRRNMARDRYKTYVVAAEKVMQESIELETKVKEFQPSLEERNELLIDDYKTVNELAEKEDDQSICSNTYIVKSPKRASNERRRLDKSRFETKVIDVSALQASTDSIKPETSDAESKNSSASPSPTRTKLSIRRNFLQKRLENKERFRTQTLSESSFGSPEVLSASPPCEGNDLQFIVEKEANLVLKTIRDSKLLTEEMLDLETLSLVSNDEDSEHNSGSPINYRTYHRSWSTRKPETPVVSSYETQGNCKEENTNLPLPLEVNLSNILPAEVHPSQVECTTPQEPLSSNLHLKPDEVSDENLEEKSLVKPRIVKPLSNSDQEQEEDEAKPEEPKGIRGRRKPLYSKTNIMNKIAPKTIKPAKNMASNLVKNITSSIKSGTSLKRDANPKEKTSYLKPPTPTPVKSSGYGYSRSSNITTPNRSIANSRNNSPKSSPKHNAKSTQGTPPLERQGTFTKDDSPSSSPKTPTKLPTPPSKIPSFNKHVARTVTSKIPANNNLVTNRPVQNGTAKSASTDRINKNTRLYNRSTSADSREEPSKKIHPSSSTQSLKVETNPAKGVTKKSGIPSPAQRSNSNVCIGSNGTAKKHVTSKIASLWKKVEESKAKQQNGPGKQDKRVWIQSEKEPTSPKLIRRNTFENRNSSIPSNIVPEAED